MEMTIIPKYYELYGKLNYWKKKYREDTSKLNSHIKEQMDQIKELKERIKTIEEENYLYQLWLKERKELIKKIEENDLLLDKINNLTKKLTLEVQKSTLEKAIHKEKGVNSN